MPFQIIRNDLTKVAADAIVNTANPLPLFGGGTDAAIYRAAGEKALLAARKKIGRIAPGEAAVTPAFRLRAKVIIHTVGPAWLDGKHGEFETLASCYRKSLLLAQQLGCASIAFPLIATGVYGFPKDEALQVALSVIREFLEHSEMEVTLVVFGREAYQVASSLVDRIDAYIDEHYESALAREEYGEPLGSPASRERQEAFHALRREQFCKPSVRGGRPRALPKAPPPECDSICMDQCPATNAPSGPHVTLEDVVAHLGESFQKRLLRLIDERGMTDPEVYKRANVDRKLFSKIRCSEQYIPKKKTIVALAIALRLNYDDTQALLSSAGLSLTNNSKADVIVRFCIENGIDDIFEVNALLFKYDQPILA